MSPRCDWCGGIYFDDLVNVDDPTRRGEAKVPALHGHRVFRVSTESSVYLYRAPDREALRGLVAVRGVRSKRLRCRLATFADVRMVLDAERSGRESLEATR